MDNDKISNTAKALDFRALRAADGSMSLVIPADQLSPRMRLIADAIADADGADADPLEILAKLIEWLKLKGLRIEPVLARMVTSPSAGEDARRVAEIMLRYPPRAYSSPPRSDWRNEDPVLLLSRLANRTKMPPSREAERPKVMATEFIRMVATVTTEIDRAIARCGRTRRLVSLARSFAVINSVGAREYGAQDLERAWRLIRMAPGVIARLRSYIPDPRVGLDAPLYTSR